MSDFGFAEVRSKLDHLNASMTLPELADRRVGSIFWMAPELFFSSAVGGPEKPTQGSDVYAYGITAWEILSNSSPFEHYFAPGLRVPELVQGGERPVMGKVHRGTPNSLKNLIRRCWDGERSARPTSAMIVAELDKIINEWEKNNPEAINMNSPMQQNQLQIATVQERTNNFGDEIVNEAAIAWKSGTVSPSTAAKLSIATLTITILLFVISMAFPWVSIVPNSGAGKSVYIWIIGVFVVCPADGTQCQVTFSNQLRSSLTSRQIAYLDTWNQYIMIADALTGTAFLAVIIATIFLGLILTETPGAIAAKLLELENNNNQNALISYDRKSSYCCKHCYCNNRHKISGSPNMLRIRIFSFARSCIFLLVYAFIAMSLSPDIVNTAATPLFTPVFGINEGSIKLWGIQIGIAASLFCTLAAISIGILFFRSALDNRIFGMEDLNAMESTPLFHATNRFGRNAVHRGASSHGLEMLPTAADFSDSYNSHES
jgi:Protein tyrosine and serine/threonine kinase